MFSGGNRCDQSQPASSARQSNDSHIMKVSVNLSYVQSAFPLCIISHGDRVYYKCIDAVAQEKGAFHQGWRTTMKVISLYLQAHGTPECNEHMLTRGKVGSK